jgi:hypothetical protein
MMRLQALRVFVNDLKAARDFHESIFGPRGSGSGKGRPSPFPTLTDRGAIPIIPIADP